MIGLSKVRHPILQDLYRYWWELKRSDGSVHKTDLDPGDIPSLLPYIMIVESHDAGQRFRFRLVGTHVAFGTDPTGQYLDSSVEPGLYRDHIIELFQQGRKCPSGLYSEFEYGYTDEKGPKRVSRLFLPLVGTSEIPEMLLIGQVRDDSFDAIKSPWQAQPGTIIQRIFTDLE